MYQCIKAYRTMTSSVVCVWFEFCIMELQGYSMPFCLGLPLKFCICGDPGLVLLLSFPLLEWCFHIFGMGRKLYFYVAVYISCIVSFHFHFTIGTSQCRIFFHLHFSPLYVNVILVSTSLHTYFQILSAEFFCNMRILIW